MTFLIYSGSRGFCPQGFHNVTLTSAITKRIVLNTILQNLGHSATFASLKSQNSNKFHGAVLNATSVQSSMAMSNTCIHASCCTHCPSLAENCSETGKSSADCKRKRPENVWMCGIELHIETNQLCLVLAIPQ